MALPQTVRGGDFSLGGDLEGLTDWSEFGINFKTKREERTPAKLKYPRRVIDMYDVTIDVKGMMGLGGIPPREGEIINVMSFTLDNNDADFVAAYPDIADLGNEAKWGKWRVFDTKFDADRVKADWSFSLEPGYSDDTDES